MAPVERQPPVCVLSLDGGGIRGLSELLILGDILAGVNEGRARDEQLQPWEVFDMMGGTSTGGIIAVMLGGLHMTIEEAQTTYMNLSETVFEPKRGRFSGWRVIDFLRANEKFDAKILEEEIQKIVEDKMKDKDYMFSLLDQSCKVFVSSVLQETSTATCLRSYRRPRRDDRISASCKVWQACRATSAATTYFDAISLGPFNQSFLDGGLRHNNPVNMALEEAVAVWPDRDILLVSIGTGVPPELPMDGNLKKVAEQIKNIVTDTQQTHRTFYENHRTSMVDRDRYFRFNVPGAGGIDLAEWKAMPTLAGNTQGYLSEGETADKLGKCVSEILKVKSEGT